LSHRHSQRAKSSKSLIIGILAVIGVAIAVAAAVLLLPDSGTSRRTAGRAGDVSKAQVKEIYERGGYKEALPELTKLVKDDPLDTEVREMLASALMLSGDVEAALKQYRRIIKQDPNDSDSRYRLGILLAQQGKTDDALAELKKASQLRSDSPLFLSELAKLYAKKGRYGEAIENWSQALKEYPQGDPARTSIFAQIGDAYMQMKEIEKAREAYENGLEIDPRNSYLQSRLEKI